MEIDFKALHEYVNSRHECKCSRCDRRVSAPNTYCMGCFVGLITGECGSGHPSDRAVKEENGE